jgi:hypothetical protein
VQRGDGKESRKREPHGGRRERAWCSILPRDLGSYEAAMPDQFISEAIIPDAASFGRPATVGEPTLPQRFTWRKQKFEIREVVRVWKEHEPDRTHGSGELYLRKHWFEVRVDDGSVMKIYFQRQPMSGRSAKARWWLYSLARPGE